VQDLGSLNGTLINGDKISAAKEQADRDATYIQPERRELNDGDELRICNNVFAVRLEEVNAARDCKDTMRRSESSHEHNFSSVV